MELINDILATIDNGIAANQFSIHDLKTLRKYIYNREDELRKQSGRLVAASLRPGCAVRISHKANLRPKYILGTEATVIKINKTTASITLGEVRGGSGRFCTGQEIRCPLDALELVEAS